MGVLTAETVLLADDCPLVLTNVLKLSILKRVVLIAFDDDNAVTTDDLRCGVEAE